MFNKILVVCVGMFAVPRRRERFAKKRFHPRLTVASAGLGALESRQGVPKLCGGGERGCFSHDGSWKITAQAANFRASASEYDPMP